MAKLSPLDVHIRQRQIAALFDDFFEYVDTQRWTKVLDGTNAGTVAAGGSAQGGQLVLTTSAGHTSNVAMVHTTNKPFLIAQDQPLIAEARLQFTEQNTNEANVVFGLSSVITGQGGLFNADTGVSSNFSGALIYKLGGTSQWNTISSIGAVQTITKVNTLDANGKASDGNWHTFRIEIQPITASLAEVRYFIDGLQLRSTVVPTAVMGIVDQMTYTGAAAMAVVAGIESGATTATNAEVLNVDYIDAEQVRYATGKSY